MTDEKVFYFKKDIIKVLEDLNMIVVSLDRISSEYSEHEGRKSDEELNALLADFIFDWDVGGKLAEARKVLAEARKVLDKAFSTEIGDGDMDGLEREFQGLQYWSIKNPKSSKRKF